MSTFNPQNYSQQNSTQPNIPSLHTAHVTPPSLSPLSTPAAPAPQGPALTVPNGQGFASQGPAVQYEGRRPWTWKAAVGTSIAGIPLILIGVWLAANSVGLDENSDTRITPSTFYLGVAAFGAFVLFVSLILSIVALVKNQKRLIMGINIVLLTIIHPIWMSPIIAGAAYQAATNIVDAGIRSGGTLAPEDQELLSSTAEKLGVADGLEQLKQQITDNLDLLDTVGIDSEKLKQLLNDQAFLDQISDPELRELLINGDLKTLITHPELLEKLISIINAYQK